MTDPAVAKGAPYCDSTTRDSQSSCSCSCSSQIDLQRLQTAYEGLKQEKEALRSLVAESCEMFEIVYGEMAPAGIEGYLVRAHRTLQAGRASAQDERAPKEGQ